VSNPDNLLQVQSVAKAYGPRSLFRDASFSVNAGEHIGVIGPNGAGKTTLFKMLVGDEELDEGEIIRSRKLSLGYLRQHDTLDRSESLESYLDNQTMAYDLNLSKMPKTVVLTDINGTESVLTSQQLITLQAENSPKYLEVVF